MFKVSVVEQVRKAPRTPDRAPAALRRLNPSDRRRVLARLSELDKVGALVRERPFSSGWAA